MIHPSQKVRRPRGSRAAFATASSQRSREVSPKYLVAIGGAAGAVGPLKAILWRMALHLDAAFIVLLHRSSQHKTRLVEQLAAQSMIPVTFAIDGTTLEAGHAYVVPPGERHARIERNRIRLGAGSPVWHHRPAIDPLFETAAKAYRGRAIAVVLSGATRNGVGGLGAIRQNGGHVLVQSPSSADYAELPRYALAEVTPDLCGSPDELAEWILRHCGQGSGLSDGLPASSDL